MFQSAWFIARKDVAYLLRRRETIVWVFVMPFLFFYFIGTVTGGFSVRPTGADLLALSASSDAGFLVDELVRRLEKQSYRVVRAPTEQELARYARQLVVPMQTDGRSFTEAVLTGKAVELNFMRKGDELAANFDQVRVVRAVYGLVADLAVLANSSVPVTPDALAGVRAKPRALSVKVVSAGRRLDPPSGFSQTIPGTMVMFTMLVLLTSGAIMLVIEREQGLLRRLASAPISRGSIVLGKWAGRMALAIVQITFGMIMGAVVFKMDWGHSLPMVALVLFGWASLAASLAIVLGSVARTPGQSIGIGVLSTMVMAALGGCWWPIEITPPWMQRLALAFPTGWTMDALHKLVNFGYGAEAAVPHVAALGVASLMMGFIGSRVFKFK
ncbi:MAG: ABC transporter permease [Acidobacteria bacterium]|nr:ABC transporter permease [Acidobacteriota bacterium]